VKKLINGIIEFRQKSLQDYRAKFAKLALGQNPDTLFIACCDSRVVPNTFASSDPGDLFVVRNIGNIIPPYAERDIVDCSTAAAIEYSTLQLNVADIVICGHSECAAMKAFIDAPPDKDLHFLSNWLRFALPSYQRLKAQAMYDHHPSPHNPLSQINVLQQLEHLKSYPYVAERIKAGQLRIHGWWFDLATADVYHYSSFKNSFLIIDDEAEANDIDYI
jgi:carbonic anhydrase